MPSGLCYAKNPALHICYVNFSFSHAELLCRSRIGGLASIFKDIAEIIGTLHPKTSGVIEQLLISRRTRKLKESLIEGNTCFGAVIFEHCLHDEIGTLFTLRVGNGCSAHKESFPCVNF
nr:MAG TPA: hypothetical protein [Caudoviricetes sp.]